MATTNTSPTIEELKAIESEWNIAVNTEYSTVDARYSDIDLSKVDVSGGVQFMSMIHEVTGEPVFQVRHKDTLMSLAVPRDVVNVIRKKSVLLNEEDDILKHSCKYVFDSMGVLMAISFASSPLSDSTDADGNTVAGITNALAANKVHIVTDDSGIKSIQTVG